MTPEIPTLDERWAVEVKWLDAGGCEHVLQGSGRHHDDARGFVAVAIDELTELDLLLRDGDTSPPAPSTTTLPSGRVVGSRDLWHWRITWVTPPSEVTHTAQSWALTADTMWHEVSNAIDDLLDLREVLRMTRRQGPKLLGEPLAGDTFDEQLADYDRRDAARSRRFDQ